MFHDLMVASAEAVYRTLPWASVDIVVMAPKWPCNDCVTVKRSLACNVTLGNYFNG